MNRIAIKVSRHRPEDPILETRAGSLKSGARHAAIEITWYYRNFLLSRKQTQVKYDEAYLLNLMQKIFNKVNTTEHNYVLFSTKNWRQRKWGENKIILGPTNTEEQRNIPVSCQRCLLLVGDRRDGSIMPAMRCRRESSPHNLSIQQKPRLSFLARHQCHTSRPAVSPTQKKQTKHWMPGLTSLYLSHLFHNKARLVG